MSAERMRPLVTTLAGVLTVAAFFHFQVANGFTRLFSESWDGRIEIALLEHWFNVLRGIEPWDRAAYFYPTPATLGYNDGYLLYGLAYSTFRSMGADPFLSSELVNVAGRLFGFYAFHGFCRHALVLRYGPALLGAAVFTLANNMFMQAWHAQLLSVSFAPALAWLIWQAVASLVAGRPVRAALAGIAAASFFDAWLMTSFYMAWFFALFAGLTLLAYLPLAWRDGSLTSLRRDRVRLWPVVLAVGIGVIGAWPFLMLYLPKVTETGMHPFAETLTYALAPLDLVHIGSANLVYGAADAWLTQTFRPGFSDAGEHAVGLPPLLWIVASCGLIAAWRGALRPRALWRAAAVALAVSLALMLRVGDFTLWSLVYAWVPGAGAVRVVSRYLLLLTFPIVALAMGLLSAQARRWPAAAVAGLAALLLAEEVNFGAFAIGIDRAEANGFLAAVPLVPASCRAFFVKGQRTEDQPPFSREDAMLLAETRGLPTLNGNASFLPHGALPFPSDRAYRVTLRRYVVDRRLQDGLCGLDLATLRWDADPMAWLDTAPLLPPGQALATYGDAPAKPFLGPGWSLMEPIGRWSDGPEAELRFAVPDSMRGRDLTIELKGAGFVPPGSGDQVVSVATESGDTLARWRMGANPATYAATIPARDIGASGAVGLRIRIAAPLSPKAAGLGGNDTRQLGFWLETITLEASAGEVP